MDRIRCTCVVLSSTTSLGKQFEFPFRFHHVFSYLIVPCCSMCSGCSAWCQTMKWATADGCVQWSSMSLSQKRVHWSVQIGIAGKAVRPQHLSSALHVSVNRLEKLSHSNRPTRISCKQYWVFQWFDHYITQWSDFYYRNIFIMNFTVHICINTTQKIHVVLSLKIP